MNRGSFVKLIKFGIVGFVGLLIDFGTTYSLKEFLLFNKYFANSVGFFLAATNNFIINKIWTFNSKNNPWKEYLIFLMIAVSGLILNSMIIYVFNDIFKFDFYVSKLIAVFIVFSWNFFMNHKFNFKYNISEAIEDGN